MGLLDLLTRGPTTTTRTSTKPTARRSVATHTRTDPNRAPFPKQHSGLTRAGTPITRAGTPITSTTRQGNALLGNTDSQIDRRLVASGRPVDPVTAAYHSRSGTAPDPGDTRGGSGSGSGGSSGPAALTSEQKKAADRLKVLARYNASTATDQLDRQLGIYDQADRQNRTLAGVEKRQHSRDTADDRFLRLKNLQAATQGINNAAGNALQSSARGSMAQMLEDRNDMDSVESLVALRTNWNAVENALAEALNANVLARRGAISDTDRALRTIRADTSAQLGNIDQRLFVAPDKLTGIANPLPKTGRYNPEEYRARLAGYIR